MAVSTSYIPSSGQTGPQAATRVSAIGTNLGSRNVPPVYSLAVGGNLPGVIAEYGGSVIFVHDDGTLTGAQVTTAIAGLVAQQTADVTLVANQQTILANVIASQGQIQTFMVNNPSGAVLTAAQTLILAKMLNGVCNLLLGLFNSTAGT